MTMKKTILRKYAQLIARCGVNVQPGQEVFIQADLDQPEFVKMVVEECYRCKAKKVVVDWDYQPLQKIHYRYRTLTTLGKMDNYEEARWQHYVDTIPCRIYLISEDPDGLKGINQEKMAKAQQKRYPIIKKYRDQIENKYQWCIAAVPGAAWAKKLFPELRTSQAIERLWEAILATSRITEDPIAAWEAHNRDLHDRCAYLNSLGIRQMHYTSANGTDFTVGMIPEAQFCGGGETSLQGYYFNPNIPTEECFISPMKGQAEGIVYATKPLSYQGQLIEGFSIRFHEGKAVEWHAEKNESLLTKLIHMDEGSCYLGECALVPYDSPISNSGLLFYNTLFDENAACHLALGMGFADTIRDYQNKTLEECRALGVNDSMVHEDFMIGSEDMNIDAICADGRTVPIFRGGNWAF
jgi:aminopeptidase